VPTAVQWSELTYDVLMIEYDVAVVEQFAYRMGREFYKLTWPVKFINHERIVLWTSYQRIRNQQNWFIQKLMNRKFSEGMKDASVSQPTV